jgi:hypothetical protein
MDLTVQLARQTFAAESSGVIEARRQYGSTILNPQDPCAEETICLYTGVGLTLGAFSMVYDDFSRSEPKCVGSRSHMLSPNFL